MTKLFMQKFGIDVEQIKLETPEIQEEDCALVAEFSSKFAYEQVQKPVLKNDGGLFIPALNNFPAAFTKFVEGTIGEDGILKLMEGITNRNAYWIEALAYTDESGTKVFLCKTEGTIALQKSGENGWGFDKIFIPNGKEQTLATFDDVTRGMLWDQSGYNQLANHILSKEQK